MSDADERDAFYQAIMDNWEDDTARLVFADWLDERGDEHSSAQAAFIRVQIEDYRTKPNSQASEQKSKRRVRHSATLFRRWQNEGQLPIERSDFERGFLRRLQLQPRSYLNADPAHWAEIGPIQIVDLDGSVERHFPFAQLAQYPGLRTWRALSIMPAPSLYPSVPVSELEILLRSEQLRGLRILRICDHAYFGHLIGDNLLQAVGDNPTFARLTTLHSEDEYQSDLSLFALASAPHLRQLRDIKLGGRFTRNGLTELSKSEVLKTVTHLAIEGTAEEDGLAALCASPHLQSLRELALDEGIVALASLSESCRLDRLCLNPVAWSTQVEQQLFALASRLSNRTIIEVVVPSAREADLPDTATQQKLVAAYKGRLFLDIRPRP